MRKIIHSKFELDLTRFKLVDTDQNANMADTLFAKTTYPFEIDLDDDLDIAFGFISEYTSRPETVYGVYYVHFDKLEKATFEIEEITENKLSCVVTFGLEQFPSWDKKLSELTLDKFELPPGTTIYQHANSNLNEVWPDINYNFPQVHIDKIDTEDEIWFAFEKRINNRASGQFLINDVDLVEEITYNRNIMQPLPSLLHVLQRGAIDAGFNFSGDIINDPILKTRLIYADTEYFTTVAQDSISILKMSEDGVLINNNLVHFNESVNIPSAGKYRIIGSVNVALGGNKTYGCIIKYRNTIIYNWSNNPFIFQFKKLDVNIVFETLVDLNPNDISIFVYSRATTDKIIIDLNINPIRLHDNTGVAIPNIINQNEVDLTRAVPNMTYGELVNRIKNWFNYSFEVVGNTVLMNKITARKTTQDTIDLQIYESRLLSRKLQKGLSFLLKFSDIENKDFNFQSVFQNKSGVVGTNFLVDAKTKTIEINALPLPNFFRNGIQTAYAFEENDSKLFLVNYTGLIQGNNVTAINTDILLPAIHPTNWFDWFNARINAVTFKWSFRANALDVFKLSTKTDVFAYQNNHIVKSLQRTEIEEEILEIEIETESL
jgi:hypothetical protein